MPRGTRNTATRYSAQAYLLPACSMGLLWPFSRPRTMNSASLLNRSKSFEPASLIVHQGDIVRITLHAEDVPHSFAIDAYRIAKKALPGRAVTLNSLRIAPVSSPFTAT